MKYYVYAGYYENFISGHKLPKPYILRDEFKTFDEALDYVWENWEDDDIFFTEDVIDDAIDNGVIDDENWKDYLMEESKKSTRKSINESINANSILSKVETIVDKTKIKHPKAEIIELDGTKYIYYSYFDRGFDDDGLDRVWDKCSDLKGVVDVGFGYGYGLENTKYENALLIELDDDVIIESKKSARKSMKEFNEDINNTAYFDRVAGELHSWYVCYVEDYERKYEYGFKNEKECINWIKKNGFDLDPSMIESKKSARKSLKESTDIFDTLENAWDKSTLNNNMFKKTVLKLKTDSFKDPFDKYSTIYMFADGSSIDCDSLDPFDCDWCTYVSEDLSFVHEFKK